MCGLIGWISSRPFALVYIGLTGQKDLYLISGWRTNGAAVRSVCPDRNDIGFSRTEQVAHSLSTPTACGSFPLGFELPSLWPLSLFPYVPSLSAFLNLTGYVGHCAFSHISFCFLCITRGWPIGLSSCLITESIFRFIFKTDCFHSEFWLDEHCKMQILW